jgi:hypothetical protein
MWLYNQSSVWYLLVKYNPTLKIFVAFYCKKEFFFKKSGFPVEVKRNVSPCFISCINEGECASFNF